MNIRDCVPFTTIPETLEYDENKYNDSNKATAANNPHFNKRGAHSINDLLSLSVFFTPVK